MHPHVFAAKSGFYRVGRTDPWLHIANNRAIAAHIAKKTTIPLIAGVTKHPLETLSSEIQSPLISGSLIHGYACENRVGKPVGMLGAGLDWLPCSVETTKPATFSLVPEGFS